MLIWLIGCIGPTMVEVPGAALPGPSEWSWPAEVPSLAGCTWSEQAPSADDQTVWTYDPEGRLTSREVAVGDGLPLLTSYRWSGRCLTELSEEPLHPDDGEASYAESATIGKVHLFSCDRHDNKVAWEQVAVASDGSFVRIDARSFVNAYDSLGQLATVETWSEPADAATAVPLSVDTYTWNADGRPLVQVHQGLLQEEKTTWTWWWDHELLLGRDEEGTGADTYMQRTYESRRLTSEFVESDASGSVTTTWEYADPPGRFPIAKITTGVGTGTIEQQIDVSCED